MKQRKYGWRPDTPDFRDKKFASVAPKKAYKLPKMVDLRSQMPPIWDQGDLGSCTAQSIAAAVKFERTRNKETPEFIPSRLFIYYNERLLEGTISEDAGAEIRTGMKTVNRIGFCDESLWPYEISKFKNKPVTKAYQNASMYKTIEYFRINNAKINNLKMCLTLGFPFIFGFMVYESSYDADNNGGFIPMPSTKEKSEGGHAVVCCGYNDETKLFTIHNSWGTEVGDKGYYYMPYDYVVNTELSDDFWTIRKIKETDNR